MQSLLLLIFIVCLAVSFLMSGMEAGVFALSRLHIRYLMRKGNPRATALYSYLEKPEDFLWTILVGNNVANVAVFSLAVLVLHGWLGGQPVVLCAALMGGGALFYALCELLPKMLFRVHPNRLCLWMSVPFGAVHLALRPLVVPMAWFANLLLGFFGGRKFTGRLFGNREELRMVMQESASGMTREEHVMINRVLDLQNLTVRQVTVPMTKVVTVSKQTPVGELIRLCCHSRFSRVPVWEQEGAHRRIAGLVNLNHLLFQPNLDGSKLAGEFLKPALFFDAEARLEAALRQMQRSGQRLAIVLEPDRSELGVVSLQDILKVVFGEFSL